MRFLFLIGLLGNSSNGGTFPSSTLSKFNDFGVSCMLRMGPVCGTFSLRNTARNLV